MYQAFFGLRQAPFDPADASPPVETAGRRSALAAIGELVRRRVGVITLEGWVGIGKTELLRAYDRDTDADRVRVVPIALADFDRPALLATLGEALAGPFVPPPHLDDLAGLLSTRAQAGQATVILVDDAQALTDGALRALGSIADLGTDEQAPVSIVLAVRPPFVDLFSKPAAAALDRRASARVRLPPFTPTEARALIDQRLRRAGAADPQAILSTEAIEAIVIAAGGIPRRLLVLGDQVLRAGATLHRRPVDYATAEAALRGDAKPLPAPARIRPPISLEPGGFSGLAGFMPGMVRWLADASARAAIPAMLLIVALGVGFWLWNLSDDRSPPPPREVATAPPAAPALPPPAPPPPSVAAAPVPAPSAAADVLFIPARRGDTLRSLYRTVYRTARGRPPFDLLRAANPDLAPDKPLAAGQLVALPGPLAGR